MREYETIFILKGNTPERDAEELKGRLLKLIAANKGTVLVERSWGKKQLAYPMEKQSEGIYIHLDYAAPAGTVSEIEKILRFDERVLRQMTVVLQKDVDIAQRTEELNKIQQAQEAAAAQPAS